MESNGNIHIGHLIREQLKADQRSTSWLAREIGCTRNHVYKMFRNPPSSGGFAIRQHRISAFAMREKGLLNWMKTIILATET